MGSWGFMSTTYGAFLTSNTNENKIKSKYE